MIVRRLRPGDEAVVERLATQGPPARAAELLADDRTLFLVAFEQEEPVGFVLAYELIRRHGEPSRLFVYEVDVEPGHRRHGIGGALMRELGRSARERAIARGWVLTDRTNEAAMALYASAGGVHPHEETMWEFRYGAEGRPSGVRS
jgi:[ribosomal protein S18]-alanine N-acetyltransferase